MVKLKILKGWFRAAGNVFNWNKDGFSCLGVGIDTDILKKHRGEPLMIEIDSEEYLVDVNQAIAFIKEYKSFKTTGKVTLGVISRSILEPQNKRVVKKIEKVIKLNPLTLSLF